MAEQKINILFVAPSLRIGGAERLVIDLANGLSGDRFSRHLLTFEPDLELLEDLNRDEVEFFHVPRRFKFDLRPVRVIARVLVDRDIHVLHCTNQMAFLFGLLGKLAARSKAKEVVTIHTTKNRNLKNELWDWFLYAPLMNFCRSIITVSENQRFHWSRKYPFLAKRFVTIHNGIDTEKFRDTMTAEARANLKNELGLQEDQFLVGILADFRPEKGHGYAFQALGQLRERNGNAKLMLIGAGERDRALRILAEKLSISKDVIWLGYQKDPRPFISLCDVLLVPSFAVETFSLAILEGLSMGKPVIGTYIGGTPEIITNGHNGFLIKPRDAKSIALGLEKVMKDTNLRKRLSENARKSVLDRYPISKMVQKTGALLERLGTVG